MDSLVPEIQELDEQLNSNKMAKLWILSFLESMIATSMGEYLFDIACHIVGYDSYEDSKDAVEYVYEYFHSNHNVANVKVWAIFKDYNVKHWSRVKSEYTKLCNED